jgi:hypothetical protein
MRGTEPIGSSCGLHHFENSIRARGSAPLHPLACGSCRAYGKVWKTGGDRHTVSAPPVTAGFPHFPAVPWNSTRPPAWREAPLEPRRIPQLPQARPAEAAGPAEKHGKPAGTGVQTRHRPPTAGSPCFPAGPWNSPRTPPSREAPSCLGEFHSSRRRRRVHTSISEGKKHGSVQRCLARAAPRAGQGWRNSGTGSRKGTSTPREPRLEAVPGPPAGLAVRTILPSACTSPAARATGGRLRET